MTAFFSVTAVFLSTLVAPLQAGLVLHRLHASPSNETVPVVGQNLVAQSSGSGSQVNPLKGINDGINDAGRKMNEGLLGGINTFRASMCVTRPDIRSHFKCLRFMSDYCDGDYLTAVGLDACTEYFRLLREDCHKSERDGETEEGCQWCRENPKCQLEREAYETEADRETEAEREEVQEVVQKEAAQEPPKEVILEPIPAAPAAALGPAGAPGPSGPTVWSKKIKDLPPQGYDDWGHPLVRHVDMNTTTKDWREEWPKQDETEEQTMMRICKEQPEHGWCKLYLKRGP